MEDKLQATIELTGLQAIAEESLRKVIKQTIDDTVVEIIKNYIEKNYKEIINIKVSSMLEEQLNDVLYKHKIQIGGDYFSKEPAREVTIAELTDERVKEYITNKQFRTKDRYGDYYRTSTFDEYVKDKLDLETKVKRELDDFIKDTRDDINKKMKDMFTQTTQALLSDSILSILQQNETYKRIETNISSLANKE